MRKYVYIGILVLFCAGRAPAQFTLVSGTVLDVNGVAWSCATMTATIVNNNGQSLYLNGVQFSPAPSATKLGCPTDPSTSRTSGAFTVQLADNAQIKCGSGASIVTCATQTQWLFLVNSPGIAPPAGTGPQTCTATLTITGTSQSITAGFPSCPALSFSGAGASGSAFLPGCNVQSSSCLGVATTPAVPDWKQLTDGTCTNSSNAISWGTPNEIVSSDAGKAIDIINPASHVWNNTSKTTIATVNQAAQSGTISQNTNAAGCGTPVTFDVYTDNAPAFNSAELAIHNSASHKGIIWYPCGIYGVASAFWNQSGANDSISYWGGGTGHSTSNFGQCTFFKISPAIFFAQSGTGLPALSPASGDMRDMSLDGKSILQNIANASFIQFSGVMDVSNFQAYNFVNTPGSNATLCIFNSNNLQGRNMVCVQQDGPAAQCNSRNINIQNPLFTGAPGFTLSVCYGNFIGGQVGLNSTGISAGMLASNGSADVFANFFGTQLSNGNTVLGPTVSITGGGGHSVQVNLISPNFNCQGTSGVPILTVGTGAIVQWSGRGAIAPEGTLGCPGTLAINNSGTFHASGTGFGTTGMTVSWTGAGSYFLNCDGFPVTPTISSGFGTTPSIASGVSPCSFRVNVGGGGAATSGVIGLTVAPNGWNCTAIDTTTNDVTRQTAFTTTTATLTAAAAWTANDILLLHCDPF